MIGGFHAQKGSIIGPLVPQRHSKRQEMPQVAGSLWHKYLTSSLPFCREAVQVSGGNINVIKLSQTPPESILLPITTHLVHFLNKRQPKLQARDAGIWWGTLGKLQLMLRKAAKVGKYFKIFLISKIF